MGIARLGWVTVGVALGALGVHAWHHAPADRPAGHRPAGGNYSPSDERLKTDVTGLPGALEATRRLRPVLFRWREGDDPNQHLGFIAQEVARVSPDLVAHAGVMSVDYARVSVLTVGAVREMADELDRLRTDYGELSKRLEKLERAAAGN